MDAAPSLHPSDLDLDSFGLGRLDDRSAEAVHRHLESCPDCRRRVAEMSADSFLSRVRDAQRPSGQSTLGRSQPVGTRDFKGTASIPPRADMLPPGLAELADYEIRRELGRGGMGVVYLAHNTLMGRDEVLKVMGRQIMERPGILDRFLREIRAVARLRHPNIVTAYSVVRLGEGLVLAMEYVEGLDLAKMVRIKGPLPVSHACNFAYQAALGLQHAHEEGLVHRDIKPGNLMLSRKGDRPIIKVLDFGLAKATREEKVDGALTSEGQALGTPDFIAPEQIVDAQKADIRSDIYSLGGALYYLLTGRPPFQANSLYDIYQAHISRDADPLNLVRPEVPSELAALVAKMMAKDPARRFRTPAEVAQALTRFFRPGSQPSPRPNPAAIPAAPARPAATAAAAVPAPPPAAPAPPPSKRSKESPEGIAWEGLIEFKETVPALLESRPKPPEPGPKPVPEPAESGGKPPRGRRPILAAASAAGAIALGIIITIITNRGTSKVTLPDDRPARIEIDPGIVIEHEPAPAPDAGRGPDPAPFMAGGAAGDVAKADARNAPVVPTDERPKGSPGDATGWVSLFNGRDIAGWSAWGRRGPETVAETDAIWRVRDGDLIGSGTVSHLYSPRGDYRDFRVRAVVKVNEGGNSGLYFRANKVAGFPNGYEAQINATHRDPSKTGSLFKAGSGVIRLMAASPVPSNTWFTLEAEAVGDHIRVWVDGRPTADWLDPRRTYMQGHFAIQVRDPHSMVQVRKLEVLELDTDGNPLTRAVGFKSGG